LLCCWGFVEKVLSISTLLKVLSYILGGTAVIILKWVRCVFISTDAHHESVEIMAQAKTGGRTPGIIL
jgi:hypothetical protein